MDMDNIVPMLVAIPLGIAFVMPLANRVGSWLCDALSNLALFVLLLMCVLLSGREVIYNMGAWARPLGIELRVDGLTTLMLLVINGLALIVALYSVAYLRRFTARHRYYTLLMFLVAGTNGVVLTGDLFNLYVFMEITAIASYALVAFEGKHEDLEASFKYAVIGGLSSSVILIGIGLVYGMTGTLNMTHLASRLAATQTAVPLRFALALFLCGCSVKAALVPFHAWLPDAYPAAPAPVTAILSGIVSKTLGLYVLARLLFNVFGISDDLLVVMQSLGGITMVAGAVLALGQSDIKRLFAYSSISQVGLILLALGFGTTWGVVGALYHLVNHAVFKPLLFLNSGQVERVAGTRDLRQMHGLKRQLPVTSTTFMVGSLALAGIPPLNGFWSKLFIVVAGIQAGYLGWAVLVVAMSIVTLAYQLKVQKQVFCSGDPTVRLSQENSLMRDGDPPVAAEPILMALPMIGLAVGCVALSLIALTGMDNPILIGPAAEALLSGVWVQ